MTITAERVLQQQGFVRKKTKGNCRNRKLHLNVHMHQIFNVSKTHWLLMAAQYLCKVGGYFVEALQ